MKLYELFLFILYYSATLISYGECFHSNERPCEIHLLVNRPRVKTLVDSYYTYATSIATTIHADHNTTTELQCVSDMIVREAYFRKGKTYQKTMSIKCLNRHFYVNDEDDFSNNIEVHCTETCPGELYAASHGVEFCPDNERFGIGHYWTYFEQKIFAALCYNFQESTLKFLQYYHNVSATVLPDSIDVVYAFSGMSLGNLVAVEGYNFVQQSDLDDGTKTFGDLSPKLSSMFEYTHLIQEVKIQKYLSDYKNFLSTIWWRDLRLGNWKLFMDIVSATRLKKKPEYISGTSGVITLPKLLNGTEQQFSFKTSKGVITKAPRYIWFYIRYDDYYDYNDDLIIVGCNSPFENYTNPEQPHVFCEDMCDEIPWLANSDFLESRHLNTMGQMFCCRRNDAIKNLDHFPAVVKYPRRHSIRQ